MSVIRQLCEAWASAPQIFSLLLFPAMKSSGSVKGGVRGLGTCSLTGLCLWSPSLASLQKEFMKQVQTSGVLMVFSQAWIEELYHQVLDRNMLGEAGYWGSPEDNSLPLITMLTGQWLTPRSQGAP